MLPATNLPGLGGAEVEAHVWVGTGFLDFALGGGETTDVDDGVLWVKRVHALGCVLRLLLGFGKTVYTSEGIRRPAQSSGRIAAAIKGLLFRSLAKPLQACNSLR